MFFGLSEQAERILALLERYAVVTNVKVKTLKQIDFEAANPDLNLIYPELDEFKELKSIDIHHEFAKYRFIKQSKK